MEGELREDFRVGGWLVRPCLNRVADEAGRVTQVQPKIMDVLVLLSGSPGEVVTKERLLGTVWAGTHVTEHVLSRAISELRKIFDDDAQRPRFIETIPKVGYRLIAHVSNTREENPQTETSSASNPSADERSREDERCHGASASAEATAAPPASVTAAAVRPRLEALRSWAGLAALSSLTILMLVVIYLLLTARHIGPWHFNH